MKTTIFVLLLAVVLSACGPAVTAVPTATPVPPPASATIVPTVAPPPASSGATPSIDPQQVAADLDKTLQDLTAAHQFNGSILVAKNGQVILSEGYGLADRDKNIPNTAQTKYRIGGMSSQFTAMGIMMLQEQGKLSEQDTLCTYLTDCPDSWKAITIHQVLTQMDGIPDRCDVYCRQSPTSPAVLEQYIAFVKTLPLDFQPGERYNFDTWIGYTLLGKVIEAVSGQSYETFMQKNIFEPLQMSNTGYDPNRGDVAIGYKAQYSVDAAVNFWVLFSAAGLYSTVEDLYRYDQALYTDKLVPQEVLDTMFTSYAPSERTGFGFGYGWYVALDGPRQVKAPSNFYGLDTTFRRYLDDKVTIIYLSNQQDTQNVTIANLMEEKLVGK